MSSLTAELVTDHPRRRGLSRSLRKYRGRGSRSGDGKLRTQSTRRGKAELTSDMLAVSHLVVKDTSKRVRRAGAAEAGYILFREEGLDKGW